MTIHVGDCIDVMRRLGPESVQTCVTSPPYFGLRDYGHDRQIGLEATPEAFVGKLVEVFREVRRLLRDDGTLWLNLGDSYASTGGQSPQSGSLFKGRHRQRENVCISNRIRGGEAKTKDLIGVPWMVAFALRADGWYLRQDIIWAKPNPMPESVRDRCTKAHEYLFLLSKSPRYYFDAEAISEPVSQSNMDRLGQPKFPKHGSSGSKYDSNVGDESLQKKSQETTPAESAKRLAARRQEYREADLPDSPNGRRNKRSVWNIATKPFREAHFATFPEELIEPCILAGSRVGDLVLDPFMGAGTTAVVASRLGRRYVGAELNLDYARLAEERIRTLQPSFSFAGAA